MDATIDVLRVISWPVVAIVIQATVRRCFALWLLNKSG